MQHYFVNEDSLDLDIVEEVGGLDLDISQLDSITWFLILTTIIQCNNPGNRDPIINFAKFVIFTSQEYLVAVTQLKQANKDAIKEKK